MNNFHYENSPSYHGLFLEGLVDLAYALSQNKMILYKYEDKLYDLIIEKLPILLYAFDQFFDKNNEMIRFNDSTQLWEDSSLPANDLKKSIERLTEVNSSSLRKNLSKINIFGSFIIADFNKMKLIINSGKINCKHTPGHTHSDVGSFALLIKDNIIINNLGCSTYENNLERAFDRSWKAHSTTNIIDNDIHEVWGSFRVARESKCDIIFSEKSNMITISWKHYSAKYIMKRTFQVLGKRLKITDCVKPASPCQNLLHLSSSIRYETKKKQKVNITLYSKRNINIGCEISFKNLTFKIKKSCCFREIGQAEETRSVETTLIDDKFNSEILLDVL